VLNKLAKTNVELMWAKN